MAKKTAGRLAGLAALAAAAYMASKGKGEAKAGGKEALDSTDTAEAKESAAIRSDIANQKMRDADTGDFMSRRLKTNQETGETYTTNNLSPMSSPAKVARSEKAPSAPAAKAPAPSTAMPEGAYRGVRSETKPEGAYRGTRSDSQAAKNAEQAKLMGSYKPRRPDVKLRDADYQYPATGKSGAFTNKQLKRFGAEERSESEEQELFGKKRGGVVKKMASGGMTSSASKRADGIATKGKTRGRMC